VIHIGPVERRADGGGKRQVVILARSTHRMSSPTPWRSATSTARCGMVRRLARRWPVPPTLAELYQFAICSRGQHDCLGARAGGCPPTTSSPTTTRSAQRTSTAVLRCWSGALHPPNRNPVYGAIGRGQVYTSAAWRSCVPKPS
jgi:hypothetical protein